MTRRLADGQIAAGRRSLLRTLSLALGGLALGSGAIRWKAAGLAASASHSSPANAAVGAVAIPSARDIAVGLEQLAGPQIVARRYDPASGRRSEVSGSPLEATGLRQFRPEPHTNSSGFDNWVLILESRSMSSAQIQAGATL